MIGVLAMVAAVVVISGAAWFSIEEKWEVRILRDGHAAQVRQVALAPDGQTLVSVGDDAKVIVWDFARRERRATLAEHTQRVSAVAFAPDGKCFATASYDGRLIVWDTAQLWQKAALPGRSGGVATIAFTPDGRRLIAPLGGISNNYQLGLWEVEKWQEAGELDSGGPFVISPDSHFLVTQTWRSFDLLAGKMFSDHAHTEPGWGQGALAPDGTRLAAVDSDGFHSIWDLRPFWRSAQRRAPQRYPAHRDRGRAVAYAPNGRMIATGGENIIVWDAQTHAKLARFEHKDRVTSLAFSKDARQLISAHGDGAILVWDLAEKEPLANFAEHCGPVRATRFSPDGKYVASASEDGSVIVWDVMLGTKQAVLVGHHTRVSAVAFAPGGRQLASIDLNGITILWNLEQRTPIRTINPAKKREDLFGYAVAISPDGRWLVTSFGVYALADSQNLTLVVEFMPNAERQYDEIYGADFSLNGRWLACVTPQRGLLLWDAATWQLNRPNHKPANLTSISFAPDGRWLVTGEDQGAVRLWQVEPLREVAVLGRHNGYVRSVAFSRDGRTVASVGDDQMVTLWDVVRRRFIANVGTHTAAVLAVAFSPDGQQLVTGEYDRSVRLYSRQRTLWSWPLD